MLGVLAFLLTGQVMHWAHGHLAGMADGPRMLYRSSHFCLLWSSLLNLGLGCYLERPTGRTPRRVQVLASLFLLVGPALLAGSFFLESSDPALDRPLMRAASYLALAGVLLHSIWKRRAAHPPGEP
ncbi:MAG TPA: hypothetical protein VF017_01535 [Thermoanaerobaculia bacterium]|nr:hypothetical protein [Thermoanaerobaculia bacterium]